MNGDDEDRKLICNISQINFSTLFPGFLLICSACGRSNFEYQQKIKLHSLVLPHVCLGAAPREIFFQLLPKPETHFLSPDGSRFNYKFKFV